MSSASWKSARRAVRGIVRADRARLAASAGCRAGLRTQHTCSLYKAVAGPEGIILVATMDSYASLCNILLECLLESLEVVRSRATSRGFTEVVCHGCRTLTFVLPEDYKSIECLHYRRECAKVPYPFARAEAEFRYLERSRLNRARSPAILPDHQSLMDW